MFSLIVSWLLQVPLPYILYKMDPSDVDWDKGLPEDVLALVANAGGIEEMKSMREVSKTWELGFELGVQAITIFGLEQPMLPPGLEAARRFPGLIKLDLGRSAAEIALPWLRNLRAFPKLRSLDLGQPCRYQDPFPDEKSLTLWLAGDATSVLQART